MQNHLFVRVKFYRNSHCHQPSLQSRRSCHKHAQLKRKRVTDAPRDCAALVQECVGEEGCGKIKSQIPETAAFEQQRANPNCVNSYTEVNRQASLHNNSSRISLSRAGLGRVIQPLQGSEMSRTKQHKHAVQSSSLNSKVKKCGIRLLL